jgi:hypothetical protein
MPLVGLRKCLNLLVQEGLVHYYPESIRSAVYKIREYGQIEQQCLERVAQSALNLHLLMDSSHQLAKDQLLRLEVMLWDVDDILLLFGN